MNGGDMKFSRNLAIILYAYLSPLIFQIYELIARSEIPKQLLYNFLNKMWRSKDNKYIILRNSLPSNLNHWDPGLCNKDF